MKRLMMLMLLLSLMFVSGCVTKKVTVTFVSDGGCEFESVSVEIGNKIDIKEYVPIKDGYIFNGWYTDDETRFDDQTILHDTDLYANWLTPYEAFLLMVGDIRQWEKNNRSFMYSEEMNTLDKNLLMTFEIDKDYKIFSRREVYVDDQFLYSIEYETDGLYVRETILGFVSEGNYQSSVTSYPKYQFNNYIKGLESYISLNLDKMTNTMTYSLVDENTFEIKCTYQEYFDINFFDLLPEIHDYISTKDMDILVVYTPNKSYELVFEVTPFYFEGELIEFYLHIIYSTDLIVK